MTYFGRDDGGYCKVIEDDGDVLDPATNGDGSVTLVADTYYIPFGTDFAPLPAEVTSASMHLKWAAAVAGTITIEGCNFPAKIGGRRLGAGYDVTDHDATAGNWIQLNPDTAYVPTVGTDNSATLAVVTAGGTNAGGCIFDLTAFGCRRGRIKIVASTGGKLWANVHGKGAR